MPITRAKSFATPAPGSAANVTLFILVAGFLIMDTLQDAASAWNALNVSFCIAILALCLVGIIYNSLNFARTDGDGWHTHQFLIRLGPDKYIGIGDIHEDKANQVCNLSIGILPEYRGQKLGSIATRAMIRKSFMDLNARRVESSALSSNPASLKMNDRMIQEGVLKDRVLIKMYDWGVPQAADEVVFRLLRHEWLEQNLNKLHKYTNN